MMAKTEFVASFGGQKQLGRIQDVVMKTGRRKRERHATAFDVHSLGAYFDKICETVLGTR